MAMTAFEVFGLLKLDTSEFNKGLNDAEKKASGLGAAVAGGVATAAKVGLVAVGAATTATVAFSTKAVQAGSAFDQAMGGVAATLGQSVDDLNSSMGSVDTSFGHFEGSLRDFAQFMGQNTVFSATQAAQALNYMALAGYKTQESMEMLPAVLDMAAAGSMDLALASDMITDTQSALGLDFERTSQMVNEFAKAASSGNTNVQQLGEAFLRVGGLARELNGGMITLSDGTQVEIDGVQQLEAAFTAMANAGIKGAEAGTHMRNMILKLSDPTDDGASKMKAMGVSVFDAEGKMNSLGDIFHTLSANMSDFTPVLEELRANMDSIDTDIALAHLSDVFGAEIADMEDFGAALDYIQTKLTETGGLTQQQKIGVISDMFNTRDLASAEALLAAMSGTIVKIGEEVYSVETAYEMFGDAIYDSSQGFEIIQSSFDSLGESIMNAGEAATEMSKTKLDNLNGDITLFKSALESAYITINDKLSPTLREFVKFGSNSVSKLTTAFQEGGVDGAMEAFGEVLSDGLNMIIEDMPKFVDAGMKLLGALGKGLLDNLPVIIDSAITIIEHLLLGLVEALPRLVEGALQIILFLAQGLTEMLPELIPTIVAMVTQIVDTLTDPDTLIMLIDAAIDLMLALAMGLIDAMPELMSKAPIIIAHLAEALIAELPKIWQAALMIMAKIISVFPQYLGEMFKNGVQIVASLIEGIVSFFGKLLGAGMDIVGAIIEGIVSFFAKLIDIGKNIGEYIKNGFLGIVDQAKTWGKDMMDNFIGGIKDKIANLSETLKGAADKVKSFLGFSEPEEGPLSNFHTFAPDMMELFAQGIKDNTNLITDAVSDAFNIGKVIESNASINAKNVQMAGAGGFGGDIIIPIYMDGEILQEVVIRANQLNDYVTGGR